MRRLALILGVVLALCNAATLAATDVNRSCDAAADCRVIVKNTAGSVQVRSWDQNRVELKGTLGEDVTGLEFTGGDKTVTMEVVVPHRHGRRIASTLTVSVPAGASVEVEAVSADVKVTGVSGEVSAASVSGDVVVEKAANAVRASSVSGDVEVSATGPSVTAKTTSGNVNVSGEIGAVQADSVSGSVDISGTAQSVSSETISGDVTLTGTVAEFKTKTVSGDVSADRTTEKAEASSVSGDIEVKAGPLAAGAFSTESGDVEYSGDLAESGRLRASARSGSILVRIPENPAAAFEASTLSGRIENAFGPAPEKPVGAGSRLRFGPTGATAQVSLETMSGDIVLERK
jgi:DUF4097 and DUF4098 domain-containing protein YvlB